MNLKDLSLIFLMGILLVNGCGDFQRTTPPSTPAKTPSDEVAPIEDVTHREPKHFPQRTTPPKAPVGEIGREIVFTEDITTNRELEYFYYIPTSVATSKEYQILFCIPGLDGSGAVFIREEWVEFANKNGLVIISPSFRFNQKDWENRRSYQFPEVWSGDAMIKMIDEVNRKIGSKDKGLYLFGHSAGAQVAHRFALFKPEICVAVAAHAPGGCTHPSCYIPVKFLMTVGENDYDRREKVKGFSQRCQELGISIVHKEYPQVGHELTQEQVEFSKRFFEEIIQRYY